MFSDTISTGTTSVTYARQRHTMPGQRARFSPTGDTGTNERFIEIAHEKTKTKRQNSLVKIGLNRENPTVPGQIEELSIQIKLSIPPSATPAEMELLRDHAVVFFSAANLTKILNAES